METYLHGCSNEKRLCLHKVWGVQTDSVVSPTSPQHHHRVLQKHKTKFVCTSSHCQAVGLLWFVCNSCNKSAERFFGFPAHPANKAEHKWREWSLLHLPDLFTMLGLLLVFMAEECLGPTFGQVGQSTGVEYLTSKNSPSPTDQKSRPLTSPLADHHHSPLWSPCVHQVGAKAMVLTPHQSTLSGAKLQSSFGRGCAEWWDTHPIYIPLRGQVWMQHRICILWACLQAA